MILSNMCDNHKGKSNSFINFSRAYLPISHLINRKIQVNVAKSSSRVALKSELVLKRQSCKFVRCSLQRSLKYSNEL